MRMQPRLGWCMPVLTSSIRFLIAAVVAAGSLSAAPPNSNLIMSDVRGF